MTNQRVLEQITPDTSAEAKKTNTEAVLLQALLRSRLFEKDGNAGKTRQLGKWKTSYEMG